MKIRLITFGFVFLYSLMNAQNFDSKWLLASPYDGWFDDQCIQLDFTINPPVMSFRKTPIHFEDNSIAISNESKKIIFYTNGCDILNGKDSLIVSKNILDLGYALDFCYDGHPSSQNIIVLPFSKDSIFYTFYKNVKIENPNALATKLMYVKLKSKNNEDIELDDLNTNFLNENLTLGHITATKNSNLKDWWLICWKFKSNLYLAVDIRSDTIIKNPLQILGDTINAAGDGVGQAIFSPDGSKYAFTNEKQGAFIFDFDRSTGVLSNFKRVQLPDTVGFFTLGCAFSSNSRFLYVCGRSAMYQIDTWSNEPDTSVITVGKFSPFLEQCGGLPTTFFKAQLAPDCRIYISGTNGISCLSVINHPNLKGKDCDLINGGLAFPKDVYNSQTLPNHPNYRLGTGEVCDSTLLFPVATNEVLAHFATAKVFAYPNPFSESLNLIFPEDLDMPSRLNLLNISGSLINTINVSHVGDDKHVIIDISNIDKGMYFLNWIDKESGRSYTIKVIKE